MKTYAAFVYFILIMSAAYADTIHHIDLTSRTADEVIPIIEPLLQQNESVSGTGFLLFIQTSKQRADELRRIIASIDQRGKTLRISVTSDERLVAHENAIQATIRASSGDASVIIGEGNPQGNVNIKGKYSTRNTESNKTQFINVEEGSPAFVSKDTLRLIPVTSFIPNAKGIAAIDHTEINVRADGFYVEARLINEQFVTIDIQSFASSSQNNRSFQNEQLSVDTSLRTRIAQWVELGGVGESRSSSSSGILSRTQSSEDRFNRIFLKVEVVN